MNGRKEQPNCQELIVLHIKGFVHQIYSFGRIKTACLLSLGW